MSNFVETMWADFYIDENGNIINNTGLQVVYKTENNIPYIGLKYGFNKRLHKKIADVIYIYHARNGKQIPDGYVVHYKDGNPMNYKLSNLYLAPSKVWNLHLPYQKSASFQRSRV